MLVVAVLTTSRKWNQSDAYQKMNRLKKYSMCIQEILCIRKEKWHHDISRKMVAVGDHYVKWNKSDSDKCHIFSLIPGSYI